VFPGDEEDARAAIAPELFLRPGKRVIAKALTEADYSSKVGIAEVICSLNE
jgi:hypothetical protein